MTSKNPKLLKKPIVKEEFNYEVYNLKHKIAVLERDLEVARDEILKFRDRVRKAEEGLYAEKWNTAGLRAGNARLRDRMAAAETYVNRMGEALERLIDRADVSNKMGYGTMCASFVRDIAKDALEQRREEE